MQSKDLEGVVVILDPGHGGRDQGTRNVKNGYTIYEDEAAYDIVCRIKQVLETQTRAKVYVTMLDPDQQYTPADLDRFADDEDELVLVTPNYKNEDAKVSVNLRWYLANSIFGKEVKGGADPRKVIFTSIHLDSLFDGKLRGTMVYIPGAANRRDSERGGPMATYGQYKEVQEAPEAKSTAADRRRDEALSATSHRHYSTNLARPASNDTASAIRSATSSGNPAANSTCCPCCATPSCPPKCSSNAPTSPTKPTANGSRNRGGASVSRRHT